MKPSRTLPLAAALLTAALAAAPARADVFLMAGGGVLFPLGDEDWNDGVDTSPSLYVRGGGGRRLDATSRLLAEVSVEYSVLADNVSNSALDVDLNRYRVLFGARFERLLRAGTLLALRGGLGVSHLRAETTSPLVPNVSRSDTDTGVAIEVGGGLWFAAGPVLIGLELALPIGLHRDDGRDVNRPSFDFRTTELSLLGGVRFSL
jgi:hypothetical protein